VDGAPMCIVDQMLVATLVNPHILDVHSISLQQHNEEQAKATLSPPPGDVNPTKL